MQYTVYRGDTLWDIAGTSLGNPNRWPEIARLNHLQDPDRLFIGQRLHLPDGAKVPPGVPGTGLVGPPAHPLPGMPLERRPATTVPARAFFFVVGDEINPLMRKVVRKVVFPPRLQGNPELVRHVLNPEKFGFRPRGPGSNVSIGRHVLGMTDSKYISASERPFGSPRFEGGRYWIDVDKFRRSGGIVHEADEIAHDLSRIAAKTKNARFLEYINDIRGKSLVVDREVLLEGEVAASAVKGARAMALTRGLQFVEGVGIVLTMYDLGKAGAQSYHAHSIRPLAAESVRQAGGWASAIAGMKLGAATGAFFGIETGPGAVLTAGAGGLIGGVAGYFGFSWIADHIYKN
jgi:hypothetical protein